MPSNGYQQLTKLCLFGATARCVLDARSVAHLQAWSSHLCPVQFTTGNRHKQNSWFCKEIREDNFGVGGGEFTKTLRKVCTCQKLKFSFLLPEYCKIRECYAVANASTIRNMHSLFLYMKCNSHKINRPTKNMTKIVTLLHF